MTHRRKAFTLVELLVVISIIGVLLGMLLPALGQAKRKANQIKDVANLQEHGKGTAAYASAHDGRMPTAPPGNGLSGGRGLYTGPRNQPALRFAGADGQGEGEGFDQGGVAGAWNGWAFSQGGLKFDDIWRMYHIAFGDWIVDADGAQLLHEVFASPGSFVEGNFNAIRSGDVQLTFPEDFPGTSAQGRTPPQAALILPCDSTSDGAGTCFLQPSYRYTLSALYDRSAINPNETFFNLGTSLSGSGRAWEDGAQQGTDWSPFRAYVQQSNFRFPSQKVMFWDFYAVQSRSGPYFAPNAKISAATVDGSARIIEPFKVMPTRDESRRALESGVGWGTQAEFTVNAPGLPNQLTNIPVGGFDAQDKPFAWFAMTDFGPRGRDLGGS